MPSSPSSRIRHFLRPSSPQLYRGIWSKRASPFLTRSPDRAVGSLGGGSGEYDCWAKMAYDIPNRIPREAAGNRFIRTFIRSKLFGPPDGDEKRQTKKSGQQVSQETKDR